MPKQTTPATITQTILDWCRAIANAEPAYLKTGHTGIKSACYLNCIGRYGQEWNRKRDVEIVCGWIIWQNDNILEAEHHAVLRIDGQLVDVTPPEDGEENILFLPDLKRTVTFENRDVISWANIIYPAVRPKPRVVKKVLSKPLSAHIQTRPVVNASTGKLLLELYPLEPHE